LIGNEITHNTPIEFSIRWKLGVNMRNVPLELFSTYSIIAKEPDTGMFGAAVQTHQMSVGAIAPWLDPIAGAVMTQAMINVNFGPRGLELLRGGLSAGQVTAALLATDERRQTRQLAVIDRQGKVSTWTGEECIREAGHYIGEGFSVQANMMAEATVIDAMRDAYESTTGDLAERMLSALQAAQDQGGDIRGMQSAALKVVGGESAKELSFQIPRYDLRVDEHGHALKELARLVRLRKAQLIDAEGHRALERGDFETTREKWAEARGLAPELEEVPFWQTIGVLDETGDVEWAAQIFHAALSTDERVEHWKDLIVRLEQCGILRKHGSASELLDAVAQL
jgi:uncharacterized Ntn-hydrolase superfamily protein